MKLLFVFIFCFFGIALHAKWHSWEETPEPGSFYIIAHLSPEEEDPEVETVETLILQKWYKPSNLHVQPDNGWWDVTPENLWKWVKRDITLVYAPSGKEDFENLKTIFD